MTVNLNCYADVCLLPIGTSNASVSDYIVACQVLAKESGLKYTMHSAGTTVEGQWNDVYELIGKWHEKVHSMGADRVQSSIRTGTRTDRKQTAADKVASIERKLKALNE